jgi:catechol 2,3-dioxygenase-like lactoylglutathione lyase family enzyme
MTIIFLICLPSLLILSNIRVHQTKPVMEVMMTTRRRFLHALAALTLPAAMTVLPAAHVIADAVPAQSAIATAKYDHISINVSDFKRAIKWYRDILGFEVQVSWSVAALNGKQLAYLIKNGFIIEIVEADSNSPKTSGPGSFAEHFGKIGYGHLCLSVSNVDTAMAELQAKGVPAFVKAETYPLDGTRYERRVAFIKDPDGNVIEFAEPLNTRSPN